MSAGKLDSVTMSCAPFVSWEPSLSKETTSLEAKIEPRKQM